MQLVEQIRNVIDGNTENLSTINAGLESLKRNLEDLHESIIAYNRPFLPTEMAAQYLNVAIPTLRMYCSKKLLVYYTRGKCNYFRIKDLDDFILNEKNRIASIDEIQSKVVTASKCNFKLNRKSNRN